MTAGIEVSTPPKQGKVVHVVNTKHGNSAWVMEDGTGNIFKGQSRTLTVKFSKLKPGACVGFWPTDENLIKDLL